MHCTSGTVVSSPFLWHRLPLLTKVPTNGPQASNRRWQNRRECWDIAVRAKDFLPPWRRSFVPVGSADKGGLMTQNAERKEAILYRLPMQFLKEDSGQRRLSETGEATLVCFMLMCFDWLKLFVILRKAVISTKQILFKSLCVTECE
jgi:hypothetical protein